MSRFEAVSTQFPDAVPELWSSPPANGRHVFRLTIGTAQQVWIGDEDFDPDTQLAAGQVWINAPVAARGIPTVSMSPGITTGRSNISGGTYQFLDDLGEFDDWLQNRAANGIQLFGKTLEHFIINAGDTLITDEEIERARWYTWVVKGSIQLDGRVYRIKCEDVFRDTEREIFIPRSHRLMRTAEASGDVLIYLTDDEALDLANATWLYEHGSDYVVHPGETRAIGLFQDNNRHEYISWTGIADYGVTQILSDGVTVKVYRLENPERGLFGSTPQEWSVDNDQSISSRQELKAVPYAEEHYLSMARAVLVGKTLDGRAFPWSLNIDEKFIDTNSLCDAADDTRMTFLFPEKQKAKEFVEEHCLARRGLFVPNSRGALHYVPMPIGASGTGFVLSEGNVYGEDVSALTHDDSDTATGVIIEWDRDPISDDLKKSTSFIEPAASREISALEPVTVEAPYMTTNRSTEGEIFAQARVLHARHARPVKRISTKPSWTLAHLPPGTSGYAVDLPVIDYTIPGGAPSLFTGKVMIGTVRRNHHSESLSWDLVGFRGLPPALAAPTATQLSVEEYEANGTSIRSTAGTADLDQSIILGSKYYHLGDLHLPDGWPQNFIGTGDLELWVRGILTWGADIDLSGLGGRGGTGTTSTGNAGLRRYVIARNASGSVAVRTNRFTNSSGDPQGVNRRTVISRPPATRGAQTVEPLVASVERGRLVGLPPTLSGSGGDAGDASPFTGTKDGGDVVATDTVTIPGSDGGDGSGSVKLVCAAGSGFVGNGKIRLNGEDGEVAQSRYGAYSGAGAGGAHGFVAVFHDTVGTPFAFNSIRLEAKHGKSLLSGSAAPTGTYFTRDISLVRSLYDPPTDDTNEWADAHSVQFLSSSEIAQDSAYPSLWDEFFASQLDGFFDLFIEEVNRSDANLGDMSITESELDGGGATPVAQVFTPDGWVDFDWASKYAPQYAALIALNRESRGARLFNAPGGVIPAGISDGDGYRDPRTGEIRIYRESGAHELFYVGEYQVGDGRLRDPGFSRQREILKRRSAGDDLVYDEWLIVNALPPTLKVDDATSTGGPSTGGDTFSITATDITGPDIRGFHTGFDGSRAPFVSTVDTSDFGETAITASSAWSVTVPDDVVSQRMKAFISDASGAVTREVTFNYVQASSSTGPVIGAITVSGDGWAVGTPTSVASPINLNVSSSASGEVLITWDPPPGQAGITGYDLYLNGSPNTTVTIGPHTMTGIAPGSTATIGVRTKTASGNSAIITDTVLVSGSVNTLAGVTNPVALRYSVTAGELQWTSSPDGDGYEVKRLSDGAVVNLPGRTTTSFFTDTLPSSASQVFEVVTTDSATSERSDPVTFNMPAQ